MHFPNFVKQLIGFLACQRPGLIGTGFDFGCSPSNFQINSDTDKSEK